MTKVAKERKKREGVAALRSREREGAGCAVAPARGERRLQRERCVVKRVSLVSRASARLLPCVCVRPSGRVYVHAYTHADTHTPSTRRHMHCWRGAPARWRWQVLLARGVKWLGGPGQAQAG